ncbi:MAG: DNA internalization-related competence protein ComEC/Rec2, partial [Shewanella sp.]
LLMLLTLLRRFSSAWERLLFALFVVLLIDPLSCLSAGFWLSFCALAIILYTLEVAPKLPVKGKPHTRAMGVKANLWQFWSVQWRLTLVLGVIQAILFGGMSVHSLWMNMLAVPWFSIVVIPLAMVGFGCWWVGEILGFTWLGVLQLSNLALEPYDQLLQLSPHLPAHWQATSSPLLAAGMCALLGGMLWCFIPKYRRYVLWHLLGAVLWMPLLWSLVFKALPMTSPLWSVHVLDVGQGLAVAVEKQGRAILYDTGAAFGDDFSYSQRVILPFLDTKGIYDIDYVFISHRDNDHAGGAQVLASAYPKAQWISDVPNLAAKGCRPQQFVWQALTVTILYPQEPTLGNNGSCVVRIADGEHSLLLTGDIEKAAEAALVLDTRSGASQLTSQVLLAPHHGSKTSSTGAFIDAVAPELVIFSAGLANRFGFPNALVIERYEQRQIDHLITGHEGQISVMFTPGQRKVKTYRRDLAPFWYNRVFRFGDLLNPE